MQQFMSDGDTLPIREISRLTGVNTVTLRAWERRYGLLVPQRTGKGHRLYSRADVARVQEIQLWLGRGLAIGKVKALLASPSFEQESIFIDSNWLQLMRQLQTAINSFERNQLEQLIDTIFSLYPAAMIADYLLIPLLSELQGERQGMPGRRAFFHQVMLEAIVSRQAKQRQSARGEKILLCLLSSQQDSLAAQLLNYALLVNQYQAEFLGCLNARELLLCAQALTPKVVIIIGDETLNNAELPLQLISQQEKFNAPLLVVGELARAYAALQPEASNTLFSSASQQQILLTINQLITGESSL